MWIVTLLVIISFLFFIRSTLRISLRNKIAATTDYLVWQSWGHQPHREPVTEDSTNVKEMTAKTEGTIQIENRDNSFSNTSKIYTFVDSETTTNRASASVEDGSEKVMETYNLNKDVN
ncbi:hypothetical protein D4R78_03035 [bacterium]|nr:MAG: hypothetical protein D4R78_03035 [bacterium]